MFYKNQIRNIFNGFLILLISSLLSGCAGSYRLSESSLMIEMEKTPCYGYCPVYTIKIGKNGKGLYEGIENTDNVGVFRFKLSKDELAGLIQSFENIHFFELEDRYYKLMSDLPTTWVTYQASGKKKKIMDYYGAPQELRDLEKEIESLVLSRKLKEVK